MAQETQLELSEAAALGDFIEAEYSPLKNAIAQFCEEQAQRYREQCAGAMATVPRSPEEASDYAARADAYATFFLELMYFAKKHAA